MAGSFALRRSMREAGCRAMRMRATLGLTFGCPRVAVENPVGCMNTRYRKPDQIIQPFQFGDPYEKKTCLWLKGLPPLEYTDVVEPEPRKVYASGNTMPAWYADAWNMPPDERAKLRSRTFPGIAKAMASQWCEAIGMEGV